MGNISIYRRRKGGFTLIELLVVITIIAILAVLIIIRIGQGIADTRNARRRSDLDQVKKALEIYRMNGGKFNEVVNNHDEWNIPCLYPSIIDSCSIDTDTHTSLDSKGNKPSAYLSGGVYPQDPRSDGNYSEYYKIHIINSDNFEYWLKACKDSVPFPCPESQCIIIKS